MSVSALIDEESDMRFLAKVGGTNVDVLINGKI